VAVGVAGVFIETHQDPDNATSSDGPNMVPLKDMPATARDPDGDSTGWPRLPYRLAWMMQSSLDVPGVGWGAYSSEEGSMSVARVTEITASVDQELRRYAIQSRH
jgi:hypothetical protein